MINVIVLWQTVYTQAALDHLAANGHHPDPADVARLSPLGVGTEYTGKGPRPEPWLPQTALTSTAAGLATLSQVSSHA